MDKQKQFRQPAHFSAGWREWALSCTAIIFCLLLGEAAARFFDPFTAARPFFFNLATATRTYNPVHSPVIRYDSLLGYEPVGGASGTLMGRPISYSADGLRNHTLGVPIARIPPILAVGDSFTEGWGVDDDETWPAYLQREIGRPVLNAGVRGYGLDQIVLRAERLASRLKPQTIILAFIEDDISRTGLSVRQGVRKPYFLPNGNGLELHNVPVPTTTLSNPLDPLRNILGYSYLLDFVMHRVGADDLWLGDSVKTGAADDVVSCRLMARFATMVRKEGAEGLVVALPFDLTGVDPHAAADLRRRSTAVLACARRAGLMALDPYDEFVAAGAERDPSAFYFDRHFTARGNALAARSIAAALGQSEH